ncbi:hypothetical protein [Streptomyces sp. AC555_RSS877]|uniref:hypothetical protein n=1 Tax=Streptomyces sp. AC555_RSS877 TaxID=2823688 RepID=UPI001C25AA90|nr:hypothetical protein [Streptomyces sp. AC555_RSS877]
MASTKAMTATADAASTTAVTAAADVTADRLSEPMKPGEVLAVAAMSVATVRAGHGCGAADGPTTTVPVVPLWERLRVGSCGGARMTNGSVEERVTCERGGVAR